MFRFDVREEMEDVLKGGPLLIANRSLVLKPWTPGFKFDQGAMCKVPIWVSFPNLDLSF